MGSIKFTCGHQVLTTEPGSVDFPETCRPCDKARIVLEEVPEGSKEIAYKGFQKWGHENRTDLENFLFDELASVVFKYVDTSDLLEMIHQPLQDVARLAVKELEDRSKHGVTTS